MAKLLSSFDFIVNLRRYNVVEYEFRARAGPGAPELPLAPAATSPSLATVLPAGRTWYMTKCVKVLSAKHTMDQSQASNGLMPACDWSMLCFALLCFALLCFARNTLTHYFIRCSPRHRMLFDLETDGPSCV